MKKDKPLIISDPFPRTMELIFTKSQIKYLNTKFKLINAPNKNKSNFHPKAFSLLYHKMAQV